MFMAFFLRIEANEDPLLIRVYSQISPCQRASATFYGGGRNAIASSVVAVLISATATQTVTLVRNAGTQAMSSAVALSSSNQLEIELLLLSGRPVEIREQLVERVYGSAGAVKCVARLAQRPAEGFAHPLRGRLDGYAPAIRTITTKKRNQRPALLSNVTPRRAPIMSKAISSASSGVILDGFRLHSSQTPSITELTPIASLRTCSGVNDSPLLT